MDRQEGAEACWQWSSLLQVAKAAVAFVLIGPPVGGFAFFFFGYLSQIGDRHWSFANTLLSSLFGAIVGVPYAYIFGSLQALLAGLLYGVATLVMGQREPPTLRYRLIAGLLAGAVVTSIISLLLGPKLIDFIAPGAVAGAASAAYLRKRPAWTW